MIATITAAQLKRRLHDGSEIAVLDVREQGQYGESHLFHAVPLPYSRLELEVGRLVPRRSVRLVVYDDAQASPPVAERAARRLREFGYDDVAVLEGGTAAWSAAGFELFEGVNLPSKAFGEWVEHRLHTPRISASDLSRRQAAGENLVVLDGRPFSEFQKMSIPGALCCPNGELALRIDDMVPDAATTVVVNCAGRTRSIVGAQTLIDLGIPNPVLALENGTQGWFLADLTLERGQTRRHPQTSSPARLDVARARAAALADREGVVTVDATDAQAMIDDETRTTFVFDVRTPEEFDEATLPGALHAPGGQLIQATDQYVGVRGARLLLADSDGVRARVVASWLRRLGREAYVLEDGIATPLSLPARPVQSGPALPMIRAGELLRLIESRTVSVLDVRASMSFRAGHLPGSRWSIRPRLVADAASDAMPVVLVADDPAVAHLAARELIDSGRAAPALLEGNGIDAWTAAGLPVQACTNSPSDRDCIDFLFFVHDRHSGNKDAARAYLSWELGLLDRIDDAERSEFRVGRR